jgi:hypothetical protein
MSNFFSSLFGSKKSNPKIKPWMQSRRLELLGLEDRITPATVSVSGTDVLITLGAGENISDLNTSTATAVITVNTVGSANNTLVGTPTGVTVTNNTVVIDTAAFKTFTGIQVLGSNTTNAVTVGATGIDLSAGTTANTNQTVAINLSFNSGTGTLNVNGPIEPKDGGNVELNSTTVTIAAAGDILVTSGAVNITGNTITSAGDVTTFSPFTLTGTGDVSMSGQIFVGSINAISSTGDVIFGDTVVTQIGGFTSEATLATKATKIANAVTVGAGANAFVTGNLITNNSTLAAITTSGVGNITITGNVDSSVAGNGLTLTAGSGLVSIIGNVGSGATAFGTLTASGTGTFLAAGTVNVQGVDLDNTNDFSTSITFAKAVTVSGALITDGVIVSAGGAGTITFSDAITVSGTASTSAANIAVSSTSGAINIVGPVTGLDGILVTSVSGAITIIGAVTTSGTNTASFDGDINIGTTGGTTGQGNVLLSGNISTTGTGDIILDNDGAGTLTINGNVSTAATLATNGDIIIGAEQSGPQIGGSTVTINGTVTTTGTTAGDIFIGINGSTATVNKALTAGPTGDVVFITNLLTDAITVVSGATITAGDSVGDFGSGILNLGANITSGTSGVAATLGIFINDVSVNLTGDVSLKSIGTGGGAGIFLGKVNGAQNLTLESTDQILLGSVGQAIALNTVTVTNSGGVTAGAFTAANVVLTDTTGTIAFGGTTVITNSLTTAAKAYDVTFAGTSVLSGAPVFLNTGNVTFGSVASDITSLTTGATITGSATSTVDLGGTIVSGGAFNIGALPANTTVANATQLILNSTTAASNFAGKVVSAGTGANALSLLGVGTLTLSGDSSSSGVTGDINVINGTLNVTGKLGSANVTSATNGTISGAGGTIGVLTVNTGTVAPGGTLNTGVVTFNAATTYIADVLTATTASNLKTASAINLGGATLSLSSVVSGLYFGDTFTIINNTAVSGLVTGTFANQPEGSSISALDALGNTVTFAISYVGGTGNDVTLTVTNVSIANPSAIPQPMVAGQPLFNFFTAVGADAGGGPMVTVTIDILPGLTTVPTYFSFFAYDQGFTGGVRVAVNDLDGNDDTLEIITGAGAGGGPNVRVFQFNILTLTFNPTPIASFFAFNEPSFDGGIYVAGGDVTGDGIGDLLVGAGEGGGPRVQVYAGSLNGVITSSPISDFFSYSTAFTGGVVVAAGDRTGDNTLEVITGPASNGGYNIKSFNVAGTGNNPTLIENFFAFNDFTSIGGLSIATAVFDANPLDDLVIGTTNTQFGVILNQDYEGIQANPFPGFTGAIRAGFADNNSGYVAVAAAGSGGGPVISAFSVDPINLTLSQTDSLFVLDPEFTGGLFVAN